ncbi:hypothetical protein, partial [Nocardia brasiliensis]|uniref:hypothetical protein n=1 Tax=Nocardia brasiliensis TaxID=37326 RepID=UPI0024545ED0
MSAPSAPRRPYTPLRDAYVIDAVRTPVGKRGGGGAPPPAPPPPAPPPGPGGGGGTEGTPPQKST